MTAVAYDVLARFGGVGLDRQGLIPVRHPPALEAADKAGCGGDLRDNIAAELTQANATTVDRFVYGTHRHAERRAEEMAASAEMLSDLGVPPLIAGAGRDLRFRLLEVAPG